MSEPKLSAALGYHERKWSIFPLKMGEKKPAVRWKRYQTRLPETQLLAKWFADDSVGVAVIFGSASGGLVSRDFDTIGGYTRWAADHPKLARTLPTVRTARGRHVYAIATPENVQETRERLGKPDGTGAIHLGNGELRAGVGCYSVLPPSVHPSGHIYQWSVPLPRGPLPVVDLLAAGLAEPCEPTAPPSIDPPILASEPCNREHGEDIANRGTPSPPSGTEAIKSNGVFLEEIGSNPSDQIEQAILLTLPKGPGRRNLQVFELCRAIKAIPSLTDAKPEQLKPIVRKWHKRALPAITTKPFEETWIDFLKGWPNVRYPLGGEPMALVFDRACCVETPIEAEPYEQPELRLLVAICRELQRGAKGRPFYLSCRTAGRLLGVDHTTANRWLFLLVTEGVLALTEKGDRRKRRASRFRYLGEL